MDTQDLMDALEAMPRVLRNAFDQLGDLTHASPRNGEWSVADILVHVRASDAIIAPRIMQVLVRDGAPLPAYDERAWGILIAGALRIEEQLELLRLRRAELVAVLRPLRGDQWRRTGEHDVRGRMTLLDLAESLAEHEAEHRAQIEALVSRLAPGP